MYKKNKKINVGTARRKWIMLSKALSISKILVVVFLIVLFATDYFKFFKQKTFDIFSNFVANNFDMRLQNLKITGNVNIEKETLSHILDLKQNKPILSYNVLQIKEQLEENSWVKKALVSRILPNQLHINIVERTPIALWQHNMQIFLIDEVGKVIAELGENYKEGKKFEKFKSLLLIVGEDAPKAAHSLLALIRQNPEISKHIIVAIRYGGRRWNLKFDNGLEVKMPEKNEQKAWQYIIELHQNNKLLNKEFKMFDLRLEDKKFMLKS